MENSKIFDSNEARYLLALKCADPTEMEFERHKRLLEEDPTQDEIVDSVVSLLSPSIEKSITEAISNVHGQCQFELSWLGPPQDMFVVSDSVPGRSANLPLRVGTHIIFNLSLELFGGETWSDIEETYKKFIFSLIDMFEEGGYEVALGLKKQSFSDPFGAAQSKRQPPSYFPFPSQQTSCVRTRRSQGPYPDLLGAREVLKKNPKKIESSSLLFTIRWSNDIEIKQFEKLSLPCEAEAVKYGVPLTDIIA